MLAQNFKSAADLGITEPQFDALRKTLVLLETGKLRHVPHDEIRNLDLEFEKPKYSGLFNMGYSYAQVDCGTVCCIRGTAELVGSVPFPVSDLPPALHTLFYRWHPFDASPEQAATALRSYLTTGDPRWRALA